MLEDMLALIAAASDMRKDLEATGGVGQNAPWLAALASASDAVAAGCPLLTEAMRCVCLHEHLDILVC